MSTVNPEYPQDSRATLRRIAATVSTVAIGLAAAGAAGSASAASCYGDYCSGKDPAATGCAADAVTIAARGDIVGARLDMRWSRVCKTAWARWQQYPRGRNVGAVLLELRTVQDAGYTQRRTWPDLRGPGDNTTSWSPMVYSPHRGVKAEALVSCGGARVIEAVFDCAANGKIATAMK